MTSPTRSTQPLGERCSNIPSPTKSPTKIPLPASPTHTSKVNMYDPFTETSTSHTTFTEETGPMDAIFRASVMPKKPQLVRKVSEAHTTGQTYVSPSDDIMSPATKKLSELKEKRFR